MTLIIFFLLRVVIRHPFLEVWANVKKFSEIELPLAAAAEFALPK